MSFAIIETGGKQYKVSASKILEVEKLEAEVGKTIQFKNVLLLNDDYTPMEFVVYVLERFFGMNNSKAGEIMLAVHKNGLAVVGVFAFEIAETKVAQVMDCASQNQHPLQCTMEKE